MKNITLICAIGVLASSAFAQSTRGTTSDHDLPGLTTPLILAKEKARLTVDGTSFWGSDKHLRAGGLLRYGLGSGLEIGIGGQFDHVSSFGLESGQSIRYGGSESDVLLRYKLPVSFDFTVVGGLTYTSTPAQGDRGIGSLQATAGYQPYKGLNLYVNPKWIALNSNSLFGLGFGATYSVAPTISLFGNWTPLLSGDNDRSTIDGSRKRDQLYSAGLRFNHLAPGLALDLAYTNIIGQTTGFSLTPSLGNTGGVYAGLSYQF